MTLKLFYDYLVAILMCSVFGLILGRINLQSFVLLLKEKYPIIADFAIIDNLYLVDYFLLVVYIIFFIRFGYRSLLFAFNYKKAYDNLYWEIHSRDSALDLNPSIYPPFAFITVFGLISKQLFLVDNTLFSHVIIYSSQNLVETQWMVFALDNFIRAAVFDFLETYHFSLSKINSENYYVLTFVFVFKSVLSLYFIKSIINLFKAAKIIEREKNSVN